MLAARLAVGARAGSGACDPSAFTTGYLLLAAVFFLALYNVRKKLPFLPLGSSTAWLQWHLYVGIGTLGVFALHAGLTLPNGVLEYGAGRRLSADGRERTRRPVSDADDSARSWRALARK